MQVNEYKIVEQALLIVITSITAVLHSQPSYRASRDTTQAPFKPKHKMPLFYTKGFGGRYFNGGVTVDKNGVHKRWNFGRLNPLRVFRRRRAVVV